LNSWKAIGYIFLGFGSVFLVYALIAFLVLIFMNPLPFDIAPIALAANAPWFILAALAYVVGIVGYFAGLEKSTITNETNVEETQDLESEYGSYKFDPLWSIAIGALVALAVLVLQGVMGFWNDFDLIFGVALPIFYSIIAGSAVGLSAFFLINKINQN
jgi:uncharacterized membrane protein YeiB